MRIGRTLPPAASPIPWNNLVQGVAGWCLGSREVERFASEIRAAVGGRFCFLVSSGKAALTIILEALKELNPSRDEVVIPAYTCYSVPSAVIRAGLKVRPCDVDAQTLDFDFAKLENMLGGGRLLAVISNHLFGLPADTDHLRTLPGMEDITIIEDAAQGFGGSVKGRKYGSQGDVALFSLGRGKAFSTVEGGIIVTSHVALANAIKTRVDGLPAYNPWELLLLAGYSVAMAVLLHPALFWLPRALPFLRLGETRFATDFRLRRMSGLQAGLARGWEQRLARMRSDRVENSTIWAGILDQLGERHFAMDRDASANLIRFPWVTRSPKRREELLRIARKKGLGIEPGYPASVADIPDVKAGQNKDLFPVADWLSRTLVTLPVHGLLRRKDIGKIVEILKHGAASGRQAP